MRKLLFFTLTCFISIALHAQNIIQAGGGSYAGDVPASTEFEDGYFAKPYAWFEQAWEELNLHENARNKPIPTNDWWTEFLFRGLDGTQPDVSVGPVTVTTNGSRFGTEAWAYPHMVKANESGFEVYFPKGFTPGGNDGRMLVGNPLKINATSTIQTIDANVVFADFEAETWAGTGWSVETNTSNNSGPTYRNDHNQGPPPAGYTGDRYVNSFAVGADGARLTLISPTFTITKKYIKLRVGGGNYPDETYVGLFINNERVFNETGDNGPNITQRTWDVTEYVGQQAEIRIVDNSGGGWGFIMCDEIVFTGSELGGSGYTADFQTTVAKVYDWSDLGFTLRSEASGKTMDATIIHGVPFTYFELDGLYPLLVPGNTATVYDANGQQITTFPASIDVFTIEYEGRVYGVHAPLGSTIYRSGGGDFQIETPNNKRYVVVSVLPDRNLLGPYDQYARNKPGNIRFTPEYKVEQGKVVTTFNMNTENLETDATGGSTLMSFLPHHWRNTTNNFGGFIPGAEYTILKGLMKTGAAASFELSYNFGGMPPYMPAPLDMTQEQKDRLNSLVTYSSEHYMVNGNSYAKGFGENGTLMLMAKSMGHPGFEPIRNSLRNELSNWLTFDASEQTEKGYYFAKYPDYGALIGFPPGYGSQGFNDLHFHNGYFTVGAARLMMVDKEFKREFADMVKLVTKTYANWEHYTGADDGTANYQPFMRTFDPYLGHSFAGGTGDGGGNNQESTSEAINSWFGVYMLGVELNDKAIIDAGATGYLLENLAAEEYWLDLHEENFPSNYPHEYVGIVRTDALAWGTYFAGDPAWVLGIQACPVDFYYRDFMSNNEKIDQIQKAMFQERTTFLYEGVPMHTNNDPFDNIKAMGPYLGGYHLNILNNIDPVKAAEWIEQLCQLPDPAGAEWRNHFNTTTNYYMSNSMVTYGKPAEGYHTSIPGGAVYENANGQLTYLLYNPTDAAVDVKIYKNGVVEETITVEPGKYYNSQDLISRPSVAITSHQNGAEIETGENITVIAYAVDTDGTIDRVEFYLGTQLVGTDNTAPYEITFAPKGRGTKELKAIAFDNDGNVSDPSIVSINLLGGALGAPLITKGRPTNASSSPETKDMGNDGNLGNRWESTGGAGADPQWWAVDLGAPIGGEYGQALDPGIVAEYYISHVEIDWETASAADFQIQISNDPAFGTYTVLANITGKPDYGQHRIDTILINTTANHVKGRYLRMYGTRRTTNYGYSFYEFRAYGVEESEPVDVIFKAPDRDFTRLEVDLGFADLTGKRNLVLQKNQEINLRYYQYTSLKVDLVEYIGDYRMEFFSVVEDAPNDSIRGIPLTVSVYPDMVMGAQVFIPKPVADAGEDILLFPPIPNTVELDGSKSTGVDIPITYTWEQISGPAATISGANTVRPTLSNLTRIGEYIFRLTVRNARGQSATDDVVVSVTSLISQGKPASASTAGGAANRNAAAGNDGNVTDTRWESVGGEDIDPQWWQVDLLDEYYITSVEIDWEAANAKEYKVQISNDPNFEIGVTDLAHVTNGANGARRDVLQGNIEIKGRYLRVLGIERTTNYGYSFFEFRAYGLQQLTPVNVSFFVPHVAQYLEVNFTPPDLDGKSQQIIQYNPQEGSTYTLRYNEYSSFSMELGEYRGDFEFEFWALREGSTTDSIKGKGSLENIPVYPNMRTGVKLIPIVVPPQPPVADAGKNIVITAPVSEVELDGSNSKAYGADLVSYKWEQVSGPVTVTIVDTEAPVTMVQGLTDLGDYRFKLTVTDGRNETGETMVSVSVKAPEVIDFTLTSPANKAMVTNTRRPTLTWNACPGATKYEIYVNITRNDYDWYASGNLLDRYTKVGESTTNSFTLTSDLVDRWTYKWYVLATTPTGTKYSDKQQFGLYMPVLETRNDGIDLIRRDGLDFRDMNKNGQLEPYEDWRLTPEERVADLVGRMSLQQKVKQLFYSEGGGDSVDNIDGFSFSYGAGNGLIDTQNRASQTPWGIPTAFTGDKIGGLQTIFPTQLGLAATRDTYLAWQCGNAQRLESKETGYTGTLGPLAEVSTKVLYNRIHEGGGENADENAAMLRALICGMQGGPEVNPSSMLITVKHWPSQGAGGEGPTQYDDVTIKYHMKPWHAVVDCNAASVMPGYSSSPLLDPSGAGSNNSKRIIDYLKNEINFDGFLVTDWLGANTAQSIASIGAGIDVLGGAPSGPTDANELEAAVGIDRINDAARRVLEWKFRAGMFENPFGNNVNYYNPAHYDLALEAARKVVTLLKNKDDILPLNLEPGDELVVGGPRSRWMNRDNDPNVIWQAIYYNDNANRVKTYVQAIREKATPKGITVFQQDTYCPYNPAADTNRGDSNPEASNPKVAVIVIGERSGTHGSDWGDHTANISEEQLDVLRKYKNAGVKVVTVVLMQRQYVLTEVEELSDAILVVYRGGNGIGEATAECLFGEFSPTGKLPYQIPRSMEQVGTNNTGDQVEKWDLPYDLGATEAQRVQIRNQIANDLPVTPTGNPLFQYGFGLVYSSEVFVSFEAFGEDGICWEVNPRMRPRIKRFEIWKKESISTGSNGDEDFIHHATVEKEIIAANEGEVFCYNFVDNALRAANIVPISAYVVAVLDDDSSQRTQEVGGVGMTPTDISTATVVKEVVKTQYFTIDGRQVVVPTMGVYLMKKTYNDGSVMTEKVFLSKP